MTMKTNTYYLEVTIHVNIKKKKIGKKPIIYNACAVSCCFLMK